MLNNEAGQNYVVQARGLWGIPGLLLLRGSRGLGWGGSEYENGINAATPKGRSVCGHNKERVYYPPVGRSCRRGVVAVCRGARPRPGGSWAAPGRFGAASDGCSGGAAEHSLSAGVQQP